MLGKSLPLHLSQLDGVFRDYVDKILHRLVALGHGDPAIRKSVKQLAESEEWQAKTDGQFSLALFGVVHFEPELMQEILEMDSAPQRLAYTLELLNEL